MGLSFNKRSGKKRKGAVENSVGCNKGPKLNVLDKGKQKVGSVSQKTSRAVLMWRVKNVIGPLFGSASNNCNQPSMVASSIPVKTKKTSLAVSILGISSQLLEVTLKESPEFSSLPPAPGLTHTSSPAVPSR